MIYRSLKMKRVTVNDPKHLHLMLRGETVAEDTVIGETYCTGPRGKAWEVNLNTNVSPFAYGLDNRTHTFPSKTAMVAWADDRRMRLAVESAKDMTDVDLQRLRGLLADVVKDRDAARSKNL